MSKTADMNSTYGFVNPYISLQIQREDGSWQYNYGGIGNSTATPGGPPVGKSIDVVLPTDMKALRASFCVWDATPGTAQAQSLLLRLAMAPPPPAPPPLSQNLLSSHWTWAPATPAITGVKEAVALAIDVSAAKASGCWIQDMPGAALRGATVRYEASMAKTGVLNRGTPKLFVNPYVSLQAQTTDGMWHYNYGGILNSRATSGGPYVTESCDIVLPGNLRTLRAAFCVWEAEPGTGRGQGLPAAHGEPGGGAGGGDVVPDLDGVHAGHAVGAASGRGEFGVAGNAEGRRSVVHALDAAAVTLTNQFTVPPTYPSGWVGGTPPSRPDTGVPAILRARQGRQNMRKGRTMKIRYLFTFVLLALIVLTGSVSASASQVKTASVTDCDAQTDIPPAECRALVSLYNSTGGPNWSDSPDNGWNVTQTPCSWTGVTCGSGAQRQVTIIYRESKNLTGFLPDLSALSEIKYLGVTQLLQRKRLAACKSDWQCKLGQRHERWRFSPHTRRYH